MQEAVAVLYDRVRKEFEWSWDTAWAATKADYNQFSENKQPMAMALINAHEDKKRDFLRCEPTWW